MKAIKSRVTRNIAVAGAAELSNEALRLPRALPACAPKENCGHDRLRLTSAMATIVAASVNTSFDAFRD
jgi:hypothetical protein